MKKAILAFSVLALVLGITGNTINAAFTDAVYAEDNIFSTGTLAIDISKDGTNWNPGNNSNGSPTVLNVWSSPANWAPGDSFTSSVWLRNSGTIDAKGLVLRLRNLKNSDSVNPLSDRVIVEKVRYDADGNGTISGAEDYTTWFMSQYNAGSDSKLSLTELAAQATTLASGYDLEVSPSILPGSITNPAVSVSGKRFEMTLSFDKEAGSQYQNDTAEIDFEFVGFNI